MYMCAGIALTHVLNISHLDYCNSPVTGSTKQETREIINVRRKMKKQKEEEKD